jgi:hypothetical protein
MSFKRVSPGYLGALMAVPDRVCLLPSLLEYPGCMPDKPPSTLESRVVVRVVLKPLRVVLEHPRVLLGEVFNST